MADFFALPQLSRCVQFVRAAPTLRVLATGILAVFAMATPTQAQTVTLRTSVPNTIVGVVVDTGGMPLADVTVMIRKLQRQTRTKFDGTFQFDSIPLGKHELSARAVGLVAGVQIVTVGHDGASVTITMIRYGTALPAMVTKAAEGGLSGIIGDTAYRALDGVKVQAIGGSVSAVTDSTGAFYMPLNPGHYLIRMEKDGYARQTVGVTIPESEGRRMAAWMKPQIGGSDPIYGMKLFDLNMTMLRVSSASAKFMTREDLEKLGVVDLQALALRYGTGRLTPNCFVDIGGTFKRQVRLGTLTTADIEFVEVYLPTMIGGTRGVTSLEGMETTIKTSTFDRVAASADCGNVGLVAWLRN